MKRLLVALILTVLAPTTVTLAGNTSSNSSSNSSNGVHTRVDTITTDNGRGRTIYERRSVRIDADRGDPRMRMRRAQHQRVHRSLWRVVIGIAALAANERVVFLAENALTDAEFDGSCHRISNSR